jgi:hypothetical protein
MPVDMTPLSVSFPEEVMMKEKLKPIRVRGSFKTTLGTWIWKLWDRGYTDEEIEDILLFSKEELRQQMHWLKFKGRRPGRPGQRVSPPKPPTPKAVQPIVPPLPPTKSVKPVAAEPIVTPLSPPAPPPKPPKTAQKPVQPEPLERTDDQPEPDDVPALPRRKVEPHITDWGRKMLQPLSPEDQEQLYKEHPDLRPPVEEPQPIGVTLGKYTFSADAIHKKEPKPRREKGSDDPVFDPDTGERLMR